MQVRAGEKAALNVHRKVNLQSAPIRQYLVGALMSFHEFAANTILLYTALKLGRVASRAVLQSKLSPYSISSAVDRSKPALSFSATIGCAAEVLGFKRRHIDSFVFV